MSSLQALVASGSQGQSRATLPLQASDESPRAVLDPILDSRQLRHARQALPQLGLANEISLGYLSNAFASPSMWQQDGLHQRAASPSVINPSSHDGHRNGTYTPAAQQAANRSWGGSQVEGRVPGGPSWLPSQQSLTHRPQHQILNDTGANGLGATGWQERSGTAGSDPLHSAQGKSDQMPFCMYTLSKSVSETPFTVSEDMHWLDIRSYSHHVCSGLQFEAISWKQYSPVQ